MKKLIFDTNAVDLLISEKLPIKWKRYWNEIKKNHSRLLLLEPLITEFFYKLSRNYGEGITLHKIMQIKALKSSHFIDMDDNLAILAGKMVNKYQKHRLSVIDCYLLAGGKKNGARIITTDAGIKNASKKEKIQIDFIPFEDIVKK